LRRPAGAKVLPCRLRLRGSRTGGIIAQRWDMLAALSITELFSVIPAAPTQAGARRRSR